MVKKPRVLVAMSGGIDSTVTAILLHEQGYEVIGITMKTWDYAQAGGQKKETGCCSLDSINDARMVAVKLGFHHFIIDIRDEFGESVIDNFVEEYLAGRTPNPCVMCNTHIKWQALLRRADQLDCSYIATGHYAKVVQENGRYFIQRGLDPAKDQSYVLWGLSQECLARTMFPIGNMLKKDVRAVAADRGFTDLAKKGESYEICFVPDNDYRAFLKHRVPGLAEQVKGGVFKNTQGEIIGVHEGYPFYTIGQRKGLGTAFGTPKFVVEIQPDENIVVLGDIEELQRRTVYVSQLNSMKYPMIPDGLEVTSRIRYNDAGAVSVLHPEKGGVSIEFQHQVKGVAPGQSAVFYEGDFVVGGGIIYGSSN